MARRDLMRVGPRRRLTGRDWLLIIFAFATATTLVILTLQILFPGSSTRSPSVLIDLTPRVPPRVQPNLVQAIPLDDARRINARVPFSTAPLQSARPFTASGETLHRERAIDCLAAAGWYEAGDDDRGQRAVMQVVLNRVRHVAFPDSVCGTVFQWALRSTGCQFTFTCDGSMARRRPSVGAWNAARLRARAALGGYVFARVGTATHYHTDWVVPYWSSSLTKIAAIDTHLFFRWPGYWGTRNAFTRRVADREPVVPQMIPLSSAHATSNDVEDAASSDAAIGNESAAIAPPVVYIAPPPRPAAPAFDLLALPVDQPSGRHALLALARCDGRPTCIVAGWREPSRVPSSTDANALAGADPDFIFVQVLRDRVQKGYWNCARFPRPEPDECLTPDRIARLVRQVR